MERANKPYIPIQEAVETFLNEITIKSNDLKWLWKKYEELLKKNRNSILEVFHKNYAASYNELVQEKFIVQLDDSICTIDENDSQESENKLAIEQREKLIDHIYDETSFTIPHISRLLQLSKYPIFFEQYYEAEKLTTEVKDLLSIGEEIIEAPFWDSFKGMLF